MNDDYLWDKSGEPDPQIQALEEILAPLRYQPKPLELPPDLPVRRRNYFPLLAIAATLIIALLAGFAWLRLHTQKPEQPQEAKAVPAAPSVYKEPEIVRNTILPGKPLPRRRVARPIFTKHERQEALEAKEQLMLALRVASEKLKLVQRRTQGASPNQIRNQHKVG